jgi:hypothetical protein
MARAIEVSAAAAAFAMALADETEEIVGKALQAMKEASAAAARASLHAVGECFGVLKLRLLDNQLFSPQRTYTAW